MKRLLFISLFLTPLLSSCSPEFGVSDQGVEICLKFSSRESNQFTAKKVYKRCLKEIDNKLAKEEKEKKANDKAKLLAKKTAKERRQREAEEKKLNKIKFKSAVLKRRDELIDSGWTLVSSEFDNWGLIKDFKKVGFGTDYRYVVMKRFSLSKYQKPSMTPDIYLNTFFNRWYVVDCSQYKYTFIPYEKLKDNIATVGDAERAIEQLGGGGGTFSLGWWSPITRYTEEEDFLNYACDSLGKNRKGLSTR
mgnify:CR=1 FL=1